MKKFDIKKLVITIGIIVGITILLFLGYNLINGNKKDKEDYTITQIHQVELTDEEEIEELGDKQITLKLVNNTLYINNNKIVNIKAQYAYVSDHFIIFTYQSNCNENISYAVDKNGNSINFTERNYQLRDFRMFEGKCVATNVENCQCDPSQTICNDTNLEFVYDGKQVIIK